MPLPTSIRREGSLAIVTIDNPPVNAMSASVRAGLLAAMQSLSRDSSVEAVVIACAGRTFVAGADIREFDSGVIEPTARQVLNAVERCPHPVVAALHGTALGAGAELALACHYRCAVPGARIGLPELTLGIIPGAGGTQRLPRLIGARRALELILEASPIGATEAQRIGLIDRLIQDDLATGAVAYARELIGEGAGPRPTSGLPVDSDGFDDAFIEQRLAAAHKRMRGQRAPDLAVEAVRAATQLSFEEGLDREAQIALRQVKSAEAKALRHLFFAERAAARVPGLSQSVPPLMIQRVAIIGAGTMGRGIAGTCADAGLQVELIEADAQALSNGLAALRAIYESAVGRERITAEQMTERLALIHGGLALEAVNDVDLVIEAVPEDIELKKRIFGRLGSLNCAGALLASNTSTLDLDEIAAASGRPESFVGLHFFSPAHVMRLLEIVRGRRTSDEALVTALALAKRLRKVGVVVANSAREPLAARGSEIGSGERGGHSFGFVGNRMMLEGYLREADQLLLEGAAPDRIDRALERFGFAMGPFTMSDMAGLDVALKSRESSGIRARRRPPYHEVADELARRGRLGQKGGAGFYRYEGGARTPLPDPETTALIEELARRLGIERRTVNDEEIEVRCVYPLINEGAKILAEGIAYRPGDIDVIWTTGYGFPRVRGGPMFYADSLGLANVYEEIARLYARLGQYWQPAPLLKELAESGRSFAQWSNERQ
ncbi:MAG TPA: 3-hydroxyacyl-CoA dehydrogenase NAD-binding domain-containing protein [Steroidobacteraceae bacterium]|nr:3-hydroxyacyl-CoA dehydrogenase NAD-binding domain-containing protein [Steroidobacteraceae bacterium]